MSTNTDGVLKAHVYFDGRPYKGLGKGSISLDAASGVLYYIQGGQICAASEAGGVRILSELPGDQMTAFTHVSADGRRLCVPATDERALDGSVQLAGAPGYHIDARVQSENLYSYLRVYDTETGEMLACEEVPRAWITHVQFSPADSNVILYNHEWPSDCGVRRMWLWDGKTHRRVRTEGEGRSAADWCCHEMWKRAVSAGL